MESRILISENAEPTIVHRRISLSFCATVLAGIGLCILYLSGALREPVDRVVLTLPNPPAPLSDPPAPDPAERKPNSESLPLKLELVATQDAWVEVDTDGQNKYKNLVRGEETLSFEAFQRIRMVTGNAAGLELRFNGKPVAATGAKNRVRTLEFTNEGILEVSSRNS